MVIGSGFAVPAPSVNGLSQPSASPLSMTRDRSPISMLPLVKASE